MILYDIINIIYDIIYDTVLKPTMQVLFVNELIRKAQPGPPLHGLAHIVDPSDEIIEVLLAALRWDMQRRSPSCSAAVGHATAPFWSDCRGPGETSYVDVTYNPYGSTCYWR